MELMPEVLRSLGLRPCPGQREFVARLPEGPGYRAARPGRSPVYGRYQMPGAFSAGDGPRVCMRPCRRLRTGSWGRAFPGDGSSWRSRLWRPYSFSTTLNEIPLDRVAVVHRPRGHPTSIWARQRPSDPAERCVVAVHQHRASCGISARYRSRKVPVSLPTPRGQSNGESR